MTRRLKRPESGSSEPEVKLTREAQLQASRIAAAVEAGTAPIEKRKSREPRAPAPGPETIQPVEDHKTNTSSSSDENESISLEVIKSSAENSSASMSTVRSLEESGYMSLSDLQSQLSKPQPPQPNVVDVSVVSNDVQQSDISNTPGIASKEAQTSKKSAVKTTVFSDGENSFLQFTFTVKLDNDAFKRPSPTALVSGTVNIVQPTCSRDSCPNQDEVDGEVAKPVVTIGLQPGGFTFSADSVTSPVKKSAIREEGVFNTDLPKERTSEYGVTAVETVQSDDTVYHSLIASQREGIGDTVKCVYEGFHRQNQSQSTHMSWDEVMKEAKTLGIPLRIPAATAAAGGNLSRHEGSPRAHSSVAKSSVARLIDQDGHVAVTLADPNSSANCCSRCTQNELSTPSNNGGHLSVSTKTTQQQQHQIKTASPLRERFRFCNLFGRRSASKEDESTSVVTVPGTTSDVSVSVAKDKTVNHRHHHHHHNRQEPDLDQQLVTQTLPLRSTANRRERPATAAILMTSSIVGSPCAVRRRPATIPSQVHSPRSASTSRAASNGQQQHLHARHRDTEPRGNDGLDDVDGLMCNCPTQSHAAHSNATSQVLKSASPLTNKLKRDNQGGGGSDFITSLQQLHKKAWYWGPIGFDDAESRLAGLPDGSFLVRDSSDDRYILSLSFRSMGATHHTRIEHYAGMFSFYCQKTGYEASNIIDFIHNAVLISRAGYCLYYLRPRSPGLSPTPVRLLYPVNKRPASLLELSRSAVRRHVASSQNECDYDKLPVPKELKDFLRQTENI